MGESTTSRYLMLGKKSKFQTRWDRGELWRLPETPVWRGNRFSGIRHSHQSKHGSKQRRSTVSAPLRFTPSWPVWNGGCANWWLPNSIFKPLLLHRSPVKIVWGVCGCCRNDSWFWRQWQPQSSLVSVWIVWLGLIFPLGQSHLPVSASAAALPSYFAGNS